MADVLNSGLDEKYMIELNLTEDAENAQIEGDERLLKRAVHNLVQNSIRHNPNSCMITISLKQVDSNIHLIVADDGVGIAADKLDELRTKSHYMESTDEKLGLRHGLGLLIVRQVIKAHGGNLEIEGVEKEGFRVTITF